jgi:4,5-dihydroxyphthalate decarboxylase
MQLRLTLGCGDYDINQALISGEVRIQGVDLVALTMSSPERHWRLVRHHEFDICELSMASYLAMRGEQLQSHPYLAIPVFPHRRFRHSYLFVNRDAGVRSPRDLEGRAVGLRTWQTTAGLWTRGILQEFYDVDLRSIDWVTQDEEDIPLDPSGARGFRMQRVSKESGQDVDSMLVNGELSGLMYPELPPSFRAGDPRIQRLWPDAKAEEQRFFQSTGIFPIMHTVVIREALLEQYPWLGMNVVQAFRRSKSRAWKQMEDPRRVSLAWFREALEEQREILGPDPWPYDLSSNHKTLAALCTYAHEQALTSTLLTPEELFHASSLDDPPQYVGA